MKVTYVVAATAARAHAVLDERGIKRNRAGFVPIAAPGVVPPCLCGMGSSFVVILDATAPRRPDWPAIEGWLDTFRADGVTIEDAR